MDSFGEFLRRERELRHIELNEIAKITRIKKSYLQAIETDNYEELPDVAFVKGFIRAYCNYIGLEPEQAANQFQQFYDRSFKQSGQPVKKKSPARVRSNSLYIGISGGIALAVALILLISYSGNHKPERRPGTGNNIEQQIGFTTTTPSQPFTQYSTAITQTAAAGITSAGSSLTQVAKAHTVLLKATEDTWVRLEQNNAENNAQEALLKAGQHVLWKFTGSAMLTVGNAAGIEILFDNKQIEHHHIQAEVIRLKL